MCAIQIDPGITTARLRLRAPRLSDASAIAKLLNDFDVASMTMSVPHPYGLEDAEAFLDQGDPEERFVIDGNCISESEVWKQMLPSNQWSHCSIQNCDSSFRATV